VTLAIRTGRATFFQSASESQSPAIAVSAKYANLRLQKLNRVVMSEASNIPDNRGAFAQTGNSDSDDDAPPAAEEEEEEAPTATQSISKVASKSVDAKPAAPKSAAKPAAPKSAAPKPVAPKPAAPKPVAPKPADAKTVAPKPTNPADAKPVAPKPTNPADAKPVAPKPVNSADSHHEQMFVLHGGKHYKVPDKIILHRAPAVLVLESGEFMGKLLKSESTQNWSNAGLKASYIWVLHFEGANDPASAPAVPGIGKGKSDSGPKTGFYLCMESDNSPKSSDNLILRWIPAKVAKEFQMSWQDNWKREERREKYKSILDAELSTSQISPVVAGWDVALATSVRSNFVTYNPPAKKAVSKMTIAAPVSSKREREYADEEESPPKKTESSTVVNAQSSSVVLPRDLFEKMAQAYFSNKR